MRIAEVRRAYHRRICQEIVRIGERKGKLPTRLEALALGTGDLDCVYHFALSELQEAIQELGNEDQLDMLNTLLHGRRLRDIRDLPFDLAI